MKDEITKETTFSKRIEPEKMLDHLSAHILALMNEGAGASGIGPLLEIYFRLTGFDAADRIEKKKPTTVEEKILKIMSLALEINPPEIKHIGQNTTAVFVNWSPHCNSLSGEIYLNGWKTGAEPDERFSVYTYHEDANKQLDEIITKLESIKES